MILIFNQKNKYIFEAIRSGKKKIETRAGSPMYIGIKAEDMITFVCGKDRFRKKVKRVRKFKSISALHKVYTPQEINPRIRTIAESEKMYHSFPGYRERLKKYDLLAFEL